jgi:hypothetical protein
VSIERNSRPPFLAVSNGPGNMLRFEDRLENSAANVADVDVVIGTREQVFHLISEASEIEHTLMCSYLYAAFSLKRATDAGLSAREGDAVERWRKTILAVATEEMLHLLLVANLSVALGGRPHFGRPNFPVAPGYFPSGVVVKLTPFSVATLNHFIYLERPQGIERPDGEGFQHERTYVREEAYDGLMPSVQDYATVGRLYEAIRLNLISLSKRMGDAAVFVGPACGQIDVDVVALDGLAPISDLSSALRAIDTIVEQGEGSASDREDSHYQRFIAIQAELAELSAANADFSPAWPAAENPVMRRPPDPADKIFIDDPLAARVLDFANAVYGLLLRFLVQSFAATDAAKKALAAEFLAAAIDLMHVLARVATSLPRLRASPNHPHVNAGMTFTMLRSVEPIFAGESERRLPAERLRELIQGARRLAALVPDLAGVEGQLAKIAEALAKG